MDDTMGTSPEYSRLHRLLPVIAGIVLVGAAFLADVIVEGEGAPQLVRIALVVCGCTFAVLGIASRHHRFSTALAKASLVILSTASVLAISEVAFRAASFDFDRLNAPGDELPIYYRPPMFHAGQGIFRRSGPASWRGKPLSAFMRIRWGDQSAYPNEQPVEIQYDALGFRNPADLTNWEVVVTGDSFVELGYLPYEELFTTIAAKRLGIRIKNLGVCCIGPVSETFYVKNYGKAASTKDAVLCFFEGNDVVDLDLELRNAEAFRATGLPFERPKQASLLKALSDQFTRNPCGRRHAGGSHTQRCAV